MLHVVRVQPCGSNAQRLFGRDHTVVGYFDGCARNNQLPFYFFADVRAAVMLDRRIPRQRLIDQVSRRPVGTAKFRHDRRKDFLDWGGILLHRPGDSVKHPPLPISPDGKCVQPWDADTVTIEIVLAAVQQVDRLHDE